MRSDREHCASRVAVEEEEERRGGEKQATDIKSNNPHLAGGEIYQNGVQCKSHEKTAAFSRPTVESRVANNCRDHAGSQLQTEKVCGDPWLLWQWQKHLGRTHSERMTAISEDSKNEQMPLAKAPQPTPSSWTGGRRVPKLKCCPGMRYELLVCQSGAVQQCLILYIIHRIYRFVFDDFWGCVGKLRVP